MWTFRPKEFWRLFFCSFLVHSSQVESSFDSQDVNCDRSWWMKWLAGLNCRWRMVYAIGPGKMKAPLGLWAPGPDWPSAGLWFSGCQLGSCIGTCCVALMNEAACCSEFDVTTYLSADPSNYEHGANCSKWAEFPCFQRSCEAWNASACAMIRFLVWMTHQCNEFILRTNAPSEVFEKMILMFLLSLVLHPDTHSTDIQGMGVPISCKPLYNRPGWLWSRVVGSGSRRSGIDSHHSLWS